jgi:hypothetical protein
MRHRTPSATSAAEDDLDIPEISDFTGAEVGKYYKAYQAWKKGLRLAGRRRGCGVSSL